MIRNALASLLLIPSSFALSADLLSVYEQAKQNDAQWAAANSLFLADSLIEERGVSQLRPKINASILSGYSTYKSDSTQLRIDPDFNSAKIGNSFSNCTSNSPGEQFSCFLSSITGVSISPSTDEDYISSQLTINLQQPLYDMNIWQDYKKTTAAKGKASADLRHAELDLIVRATEAYFKVLRAQDDMSFATADEQSLRRSLNVAKQRYAAGIDLETEVYDAQAAYDLRLGNLELARAQLDNAQRELTVLTHSYDMNLHVLQSNIPVVPPVPTDSKEWAKQAANYNPLLESGRYQVEVAKRDYHKKKTSYLPTVYLQAKYESLETEGGQGGLPASERSQIGISVNMPLYQGGLLSTERKIAFYKYQEAKDRLLNEQIKVQSGTEALHQLINANVGRIKSLKRSVVSTANSLRATQRSYEDGTRSIRDVINVQTNLGQLTRDLSQARYSYIINSLKLKQVSGVLTEDDLVALNSWLRPVVKKPVSNQQSGRQNRR